ncbi:MAG: hypothetical protein ACBZ72_08875 [Candidatus Bathyarchaeia archaeon]|jgi:HEPN domain-containing protein
MTKYYPIDFFFDGTPKSEQYFVYADVNKQAVELLLDAFSEESTAHSHSLAPVVYLLRQYIELQLKGIIAFNEECHVVWRTHNIQSLYEEAMRNVKKQYGTDQIGQANPEVEKFILALSNFDPKCEAFRYPETVDGESFAELAEKMDPWLYETITVFEKFADIATKVIDDLEGIEGYLDIMWANEQEGFANQ